MQKLSRFFKITNIVIKNGHMSLSRSDEKNSLIRKIFFYFIMFFVFVNLIFGFFVFTFRAYRVLERIDEQSLIIALTLQMITLAVFIFALFYVISVMYFSNDIDNFMGLPLKPYEIFIGKFINVVIYEYFAEILFVLPILIAYGIVAKMTVLYYVYGLIILATIPIIPVAIVSVIYLLIMSVLKISNNSERTKMIAAIIFIIAGLVMNVGIQKIGISLFDDKKLEQIILNGKGSILKSVSFLFPTSGLASETLIYNNTSKGLFKFILYLISNIAAVIVVVLLSQKLYFKGILNSKSSRKTALENINYYDISKLNFNVQQSPFIAMLKREYRNLFRTSAYFINCVLISLFMPIFILTTAAIQKGQMNKYYSSADYLANPSNFGSILSWMLMLIIFLGACNFTSATAISREGSDIYFLRAIPFKVSDYINSKIIASASISFTSMMVLLIPITIYFKIPFYYFAMMILLGTLGIIFTVEMGILIDSIYPKLNWDSEQKAVMQNFNPIFSIILVVILSGIVNTIGTFLGMDFKGTWLFLLISYSFIDIVIYSVLIKRKV